MATVKKAAAKKKTAKAKPLLLGKGGGKGGILPLSGKPVKKAVVKKKAAPVKATKTSKLKLGSTGKGSG